MILVASFILLLKRMFLHGKDHGNIIKPQYDPGWIVLVCVNKTVRIKSHILGDGKDDAIFNLGGLRAV